MISRGLIILLFDDLRRNLNHFSLAAVGIVVGIAGFTFFLSLGAGVREVVLGKIFPLDKIEVTVKTADFDLGPLRMNMGADSLGDEAIDKLKTIPHVINVLPKMKLTAPSIAAGGKKLLGNDMVTELIADGIDPQLVENDVDSDYAFQFWDDSKTNKLCTKDVDCEDDMEYCGKPVGETQALVPRVCRHYVPVLASNHLVEIYNGTVRRAHSLPKLNPDFVIGLRFSLKIGASMVDASRRQQVIEERGILVGFSDRAIPLGLTLPLGYVSHYNVLFDSPKAANVYHSVVVDIDAKDHVASVAKAVEDMGFEVSDHGAKQAALLITVVMMVFAFVSTVIIAIAAVNIMHVFFMLIYQRQREIGIMRAVGATRGNIQTLILGEAAVVGFVSGIFGVILAILAGLFFDYLSIRYIPDFPYKPTTYFHFGPLLILGSLAFAVGFCLLGAVLPARRAARMDPALVLTGQ